MNILKLIFGPFIKNMNQTIPENCILIDVRSPSEYSTGYIEGSFNIPMGSAIHDYKNICKNLDAAIVGYCASGMRSASVRSALLSNGFSNVINGGGVGSVALKTGKRIVR
jgi:rhodanese-related sulfurtransferase